DWHSLINSGQTLDRTIRTLYARRRGVIGCYVWTAASLVLGSGEIWIALHAIGRQATLVNALIFQSVILAIRSAMFPVPGALGVQEGGYVVVGNLLGVPDAAAFHLFLIACVCEVCLATPVLISCHVFDGPVLCRARLAAS